MCEYFYIYSFHIATAIHDKYNPDAVVECVFVGLFLYTDGLDEAENAQRQMFGKERITEVLQTASPEPQTLIKQMTQAVVDFVGDTEQSDDLTMLALQYL
jgi:hypothetical protein